MSDTMNVKMTPTCLKCGHVGIVIPDDPTDNSVITCESCGANLGTHGQLQAKIRETAIEAAREAFGNAIKDGLKGSSTIKLKF